MSYCDIHILAFKGREKWLSRALKSLGGQPCKVHVCDGIPGHIGLGRSRAFKLGDSEYVGYVDDDDYVEQGAVLACLKALEANPVAVGAFTDEVVVNEGGARVRKGLSTGWNWSAARQVNHPAFLHHLWVGKRAEVEKYLHITKEHERLDAYVLTCLMAINGPWVHVEQVGYRWTVHSNCGHKLITARSVKDARQFILGQWKAAGLKIR